MALTKDYYEKYWTPEGFSPRVTLPKYLERVYSANIESSSVCLDLGCGDGLKSGPWVSENAASYLGADISSTAVAKARESGLSAEVIEDAASLPFDDNSFDVVICMEVMEHLFRPDKAAVEIVRVLRPGGKLLATVPNIAYWRRRVDLMFLGR